MRSREVIHKGMSCMSFEENVDYAHGLECLISKVIKLVHEHDAMEGMYTPSTPTLIEELLFLIDEDEDDDEVENFVTEIATGWGTDHDD